MSEFNLTVHVDSRDDLNAMADQLSNVINEHMRGRYTHEDCLRMLKLVGALDVRVVEDRAEANTP